MSLDNSVARVRALTALVQVGARLLEVGELEGRVEALEAAVAHTARDRSPFDLEPGGERQFAFEGVEA